MPFPPPRVDRHELLALARATLAAGDPQALADELTRRWSPRQLCQMLSNRCVDTRRVTAVALGLVGDASCIGCLARALHDADSEVSALAEHGLWSIWFRVGKPAATPAFTAGVAALDRDAYADAIRHFEAAAKADPDFAEAFNQCAIAHFFLGQWREAIVDSQRALERMPSHFGAMAGMGHCHVQLGEPEAAMCCYRRALAIHPRQPNIADALARLERAAADRSPLAVSSRYPSR